MFLKITKCYRNVTRPNDIGIRMMYKSSSAINYATKPKINTESRLVQGYHTKG